MTCCLFSSMSFFPSLFLLLYSQKLPSFLLSRMICPPEVCFRRNSIGRIVGQDYFCSLIFRTYYPTNQFNNWQRHSSSSSSVTILSGLRASAASSPLSKLSSRKKNTHKKRTRRSVFIFFVFFFLCIYIVYFHVYALLLQRCSATTSDAASLLHRMLNKVSL